MIFKNIKKLIIMSICMLTFCSCTCHINNCSGIVVKVTYDSDFEKGGKPYSVLVRYKNCDDNTYANFYFSTNKKYNVGDTITIQ